MSDRRDFGLFLSLEPGLRVGLLLGVDWHGLRGYSDFGLFFVIETEAGEGGVGRDIRGWWCERERGQFGLVGVVGTEISGLVFAIDRVWVKRAGLSLERLRKYGDPILLPGLTRSLIRGITIQLEEKRSRKLLIKSKVFELLDILFSDGEKCQDAQDWRVRRVKEILREGVSYRLSLAELGKEVGCSPYYLSRIFSEGTGQTLSNYMRRLRLERARELIEWEGKNVTEAAYDVGYSSLSHFSREFAKYFRRLPKSFKFKKG